MSSQADQLQRTMAFFKLDAAPRQPAAAPAPRPAAGKPAARRKLPRQPALVAAGVADEAEFVHY
jgi:methyl-accepting chemotaxis protein